jgi:hypothetical protein
MNVLFEKIYTEDNLSWYTWSYTLRRKLVLISEELSLIDIQLSNLFPNEPYGTSYVSRNNINLSKISKDIVSYIAINLIKLEPSNEIMLFKNLLFDNFTAKSLHVLFTLLAAEMRIKNNIPALHSPIVEKYVDNSFPVHADLFKTRSLFNVVAETETDKNGDILLLSINELEEAMNAVSSLPKNIQDIILKTLKFKVDSDCFDNIYSLMYGENQWKESLSHEIEKRQITLSSQNGTGYLITDGMWLHGRKEYFGKIKENRLNRLLFDTYKTEKIPKVNINYPINKSIYNAKSKKSKSFIIKSKSIPYEIDNNIDSYLKDKSIATDFQSSVYKLKEKLLASMGNI